VTLDDDTELFVDILDEFSDELLVGLLALGEAGFELVEGLTVGGLEFVELLVDGRVDLVELCVHARHRPPDGVEVAVDGRVGSLNELCLATLGRVERVRGCCEHLRLVVERLLERVLALRDCGALGVEHRRDRSRVCRHSELLLLLTTTCGQINVSNLCHLMVLSGIERSTAIASGCDWLKRVRIRVLLEARWAVCGPLDSDKRV
jgi:hypothetical protein